MCFAVTTGKSIPICSRAICSNLVLDLSLLIHQRDRLHVKHVLTTIHVFFCFYKISCGNPQNLKKLQEPSISSFVIFLLKYLLTLLVAPRGATYIYWVYKRPGLLIGFIWYLCIFQYQGSEGLINVKQNKADEQKAYYRLLTLFWGGLCMHFWWLGSFTSGCQRLTVLVGADLI